MDEIVSVQSRVLFRRCKYVPNEKYKYMLPFENCANLYFKSSYINIYSGTLALAAINSISNTTDAAVAKEQEETSLTSIGFSGANYVRAIIYVVKLWRQIKMSNTLFYVDVLAKCNNPISCIQLVCINVSLMVVGRGHKL